MVKEKDEKVLSARNCHTSAKKFQSLDFLHTITAQRPSSKSVAGSGTR
jgi:hypothetical protein